MPAGCEFICNNVNCLYYRSGFSIIGPWPMGKIELIISSINPTLPNQLDYKSQLQKWRDEGRKYACLVLPNVTKVPIAAYRVNMWDETNKCIWSYDVELNENETLEEAIKRVVPTATDEGNTLIPFAEVLEKGINCPHCQEELQQSRWFSNNE